VGVPQEIRFDGVRVRYHSAKRYDELLAALLSDIGEQPVSLDDMVRTSSDWESFQRDVEPLCGPGGFMFVRADRPRRLDHQGGHRAQGDARHPRQPIDRHHDVAA